MKRRLKIRQKPFIGTVTVADVHAGLKQAGFTDSAADVVNTLKAMAERRPDVCTFFDGPGLIVHKPITFDDYPVDPRERGH